MQSKYYAALFITLAIYLIFFFYLPVINVFKMALSSFSALSIFFFEEYTIKVLTFTFVQASLSTFGSLIVGLPGAYIIGTYNFSGKQLIYTLTLLSFTFPTLLAIIGFVIIWGNNGLINTMLMKLFASETPPLRLIYSLQGIIAAHVFFNFPIVIRIVGHRWMKIDPRLQIAAKLSGHRATTIFKKIYLPQLLPAVKSCSILIFTLCFLSFSIVLVLGGSPSLSTLEVLIYQQVHQEFNLPLATKFALLESIFLWILIILPHLSQVNPMRWFQNITRNIQKNVITQFNSKDNSETPSLRLPALNAASKSTKRLIVAYFLTTSAFIFLPMIGIIFIHGNLEFFLATINQRYDPDIGTSLISPIKNSLVIALLSSAIATGLGSVASYSLFRTNKTRPTWSTLLLYFFVFSPFITSPIILSLGITISYPQFLSTWANKIWLISLTHALITYPFIIQSLNPIWPTLSPRLIHAAKLLSGSQTQILQKIVFPTLAKPVLSAFALAFSISLSEVSISFMLTDERSITIPVAIYRLISVYRFSDACTLGLYIVGFSLLGSLVIERFMGKLIWKGTL